MKFLDNLTNSKQVEKLERERKDASKIPEKTLNKISEGKKLTGSRFSDRHPVRLTFMKIINFLI